MHPWKGRTFQERKAKADQMREWLRLNPHLRIKSGTKSNNGLVFCGYGAGYANGEHWASQAVFEKRQQASREQMRRLRKSDAYKKHFNAYSKQRYAEKELVRKKMKDRTEKWASQNKHLRAQHSSNRRALKRNQLHQAHDFEIESKMHAEARSLTLKTGIEHHVDHIIPIKHGGWHHHENLQVLPERVNLEKGCDPFWQKDGFKNFRDVPQELWPEDLASLYLAKLTT